ncbi:DUF2231 domain-containing protein [Chthonobacter rhizosphaerae]|uniref:DUF2231 domain-containing protein n=1 Tax=Chthonobacter rhizosphaerae TaxID=2735553 RepID=UPI001FE6CD07|nr:DUF2231 domain-containing protein [Chthonobacter rhizosphaerae]
MRHPQGSGSAAAISGHPLHPMVVPFPLASLMFSFVADIAHLVSEDPFWARASLTLIVVGIVTGVAAAALGAWDLMRVPRARQLGKAWAHGLINGVVMLLALVNWATRSGTDVTALNMILSFATVVLLGISGWLGGDLSYKHGVGVSPEIGGGESADRI